MKNALLGLLGGILVIIVIAMLMPAEDVEKVQPTATPTPTRQQPVRYESELTNLRSDFMLGCVEDGYEAYCGCTWDYMNNNTTNAELMAEFLEYDETKEFSPLMLNAIDECAYLVE